MKAHSPSDSSFDVGLSAGRDGFQGLSAGMMLSVFDAPLFIRRHFVDLTGSITAALMLTYAVDLYSHHDPIVTPNEHGWFMLNTDTWQRETGLTRTEQATARRRLRELDLIEERLIGMPARLVTRVAFDRLHAAMLAEDDKREACRHETHRHTT